MFLDRNKTKIEELEFSTEVRFVPSGSYCNIAIEDNGLFIIVPLMIEDCLEKLFSGSQFIPTPYTYGHDGEELHEWDIVGYEVLYKENKNYGLIFIHVKPKYGKKLFPNNYQDEIASQLEGEN